MTPEYTKAAVTVEAPPLVLLLKLFTSPLWSSLLLYASCCLLKSFFHHAFKHSQALMISGTDLSRA